MSKHKHVKGMWGSARKNMSSQPTQFALQKEDKTRVEQFFRRCQPILKFKTTDKVFKKKRIQNIRCESKIGSANSSINKKCQTACQKKLNFKVTTKLTSQMVTLKIQTQTHSSKGDYDQKPEKLNLFKNDNHKWSAAEGCIWKKSRFLNRIATTWLCHWSGLQTW